MQQKPLKRYAQPTYPTNIMFQSHPEMLRIVPKRWQHSALVFSCFIAFMAASSGYNKASGADLSKWAGDNIYIYSLAPDPCAWLMPRVDPNNNMLTIIEEESEPARFSFNTPLFRHLLKSHSTEFWVKEPNRIFDPQASIYKAIDHIKPLTNIFPESPDELDGIDQSHQIAFEYVSTADAKMWGYETPLEAAEALKVRLEHANPLYHYAIFTETDEETLRFQVRCFIQWLKIQGVL